MGYQQLYQICFRVLFLLKKAQKRNTAFAWQSLQQPLQRPHRSSIKKLTPMRQRNISSLVKKITGMDNLANIFKSLNKVLLATAFKAIRVNFPKKTQYHIRNGELSIYRAYSNSQYAIITRQVKINTSRLERMFVGLAGLMANNQTNIKKQFIGQLKLSCQAKKSILKRKTEMPWVTELARQSVELALSQRQRQRYVNKSSYQAKGLTKLLLSGNCTKHQ